MELTTKESKHITSSQKIIGRTLYTIQGTEYLCAENAIGMLMVAYMVIILTSIQF